MIHSVFYGCRLYSRPSIPLLFTFFSRSHKHTLTPSNPHSFQAEGGDKEHKMLRGLLDMLSFCWLQFCISGNFVKESQILLVFECRLKDISVFFQKTFVSRKVLQSLQTGFLFLFKIEEMQIKIAIKYLTFHFISPAILAVEFNFILAEPRTSVNMAVTSVAKGNLQVRRQG